LETNTKEYLRLNSESSILNSSHNPYKNELIYKYDTMLEYSNEGNAHQQGHVGQEGVTNFTNVDGLRRSTRKSLEPKWKRN